MNDALNSQPGSSPVKMTAGPASVKYKSKKEKEYIKMVQGGSAARDKECHRAVARNMKPLANYQGMLPHATSLILMNMSTTMNLDSTLVKC